MRVVALALSLALIAATPDEAVLDLTVHGADGPPRTLRTMVGDGPAIVTLWATYCAPCKMEVPVLNRANDRWAERGVRILGVAVDTDDPAEVEAVSRSWGIEYPVVWAPADERPQLGTLLPRGVPTTFLIGRGQVHRHEGVLDDAEIDRLVRGLLGPKPATAAPQATLTVAPAPW
ncbi:MAG TPA: TlpA disulfide reductase family protein [Candidatus Binatia bacterium]|jgi:thiol-disulfide isomerase/thioredoxin|nr:TlpA disulfide reductase family protein [Candidatus Binatia bacterium]